MMRKSGGHSPYSIIREGKKIRIAKLANLPNPPSNALRYAFICAFRETVSEAPRDEACCSGIICAKAFSFSPQWKLTIHHLSSPDLSINTPSGFRVCFEEPDLSIAGLRIHIIVLTGCIPVHSRQILV